MPEVLVVTPDFPPEIGGIQTLTSRLASSFTRYRPSVLAPGMANADDFDGAQPYPVLRAGRGDRGHRLRIAALNGFAFAEALRRKPDVLLAMHVISGPSAIAAGKLLRRPVVLYAHGQELTVRPRLTRRVIRRPTAVIAVSDHTRRTAERLGAAADRVRVIHPGIDEPVVQPQSRADVPPAVVVVARLEERYKGHDVLLRAMGVVRTRVPDTRLHVVGDGSLRGELERLAAHAGVADITTFHGVVSDAERDELLRNSAVFAMPSRLDDRGSGEGFGIVYVEAAAHGLPVVAGRVGGAVDAVVDGETGLLVDPEDDAAVADAIASLLLDRERALRIGNAGWRRARTLSWARTADDVERVLDEVTAA